MPGTVVCPSTDDFHTSLSEVDIRAFNGLHEGEQNRLWAVVIREFVQEPFTSSFD